ncbi:unnamed protein product [Diabrotica balteata]|uniref:Transmembrane protein n=1 Tax=Diabrotica balteata TaxID=107213 RepID=A0A9N9SXH8_DIABA|nr:unnamed protein product [Diabrotica balteata]
MADKADWRISEKFRKPRRTKGTPAFQLRNYFAFGGLAFGAISWYLYENWSATKKVRKSFLEGKFDMPDGLILKIKHIEASTRGGAVDELLAKAREREVQKYAPDKPEDQPWLIKIFNSKPDI